MLARSGNCNLRMLSLPKKAQTTIVNNTVRLRLMPMCESVAVPAIKYSYGESIHSARKPIIARMNDSWTDSLLGYCENLCGVQVGQI